MLERERGGAVRVESISEFIEKLENVFAHVNEVLGVQSATAHARIVRTPQLTIDPDRFRVEIVGGTGSLSASDIGEIIEVINKTRLRAAYNVVTPGTGVLTVTGIVSNVGDAHVTLYRRGDKILKMLVRASTREAAAVGAVTALAVATGRERELAALISDASKAREFVESVTSGAEIKFSRAEVKCECRNEVLESIAERNEDVKMIADKVVRIAKILAAREAIKITYPLAAISLLSMSIFHDAPKNLLVIGPPGTSKTRVAVQLARIVEKPVLVVENSASGDFYENYTEIIDTLIRNGVIVETKAIGGIIDDVESVGNRAIVKISIPHLFKVTRDPEKVIRVLRALAEKFDAHVEYHDFTTALLDSNAVNSYTAHEKTIKIIAHGSAPFVVYRGQNLVKGGDITVYDEITRSKRVTSLLTELSISDPLNSVILAIGTSNLGPFLELASDKMNNEAFFDRWHSVVVSRGVEPARTYTPIEKAVGEKLSFFDLLAYGALISSVKPENADDYTVRQVLLTVANILDSEFIIESASSTDQMLPILVRFAFNPREYGRGLTLLGAETLKKWMYIGGARFSWVVQDTAKYYAVIRGRDTYSMYDLEVAIDNVLLGRIAPRIPTPDITWDKYLSVVREFSSAVRAVVETALSPENLSVAGELEKLLVEGRLDEYANRVSEYFNKVPGGDIIKMVAAYAIVTVAVGRALRRISEKLAEEGRDELPLDVLIGEALKRGRRDLALHFYCVTRAPTLHVEIERECEQRTY